MQPLPKTNETLPKKTIPGSLIAQGLSGLNDAKIQTFLKVQVLPKKKSDFHNLVADLNHMIHSIKQRMGIYIHPLEELHNTHIAKHNALCINLSVITKAYWLVMCNSITHIINDIQRIKNKCIIILELRGRSRLVRKYV